MCDQWQDTWSVPVWGLAVEDPSGTFSSVPRQCHRKSDCLQVNKRTCLINWDLLHFFQSHLFVYRFLLFLSKTSVKQLPQSVRMCFESFIGPLTKLWSHRTFPWHVGVQRVLETTDIKSLQCWLQKKKKDEKMPLTAQAEENNNYLICLIHSCERNKDFLFIHEK